MIWLGNQRGYLADWLTQRWVHLTGRNIDLASNGWLSGPVAPTTGIGADYFATLAEAEGLRLCQPGGTAGVMARFAALAGPGFNPAKIHPNVVRFYEETTAYELDAWAEWCGAFRPFGWMLAVLFSRRLQQLNVPLSGLDTSRGLTNEVLQFVDPTTGEVRHTAWYRRLLGSGNILYAGFYSVCRLPGGADPCVKVVFPLPNGNAIVLMRTECGEDGSFLVISSGEGFGTPGFYFTVHSNSEAVWGRYVHALRESIHVYPAEEEACRADHVLSFFGARFLRLHYRMRRRVDPVQLKDTGHQESDSEVPGGLRATSP